MNIVLLASLLLAANAAAAPIYSTDFETSEGYVTDASIHGINGWTVTNDTASAKVVAPALNCGGARCLSLGPTAAESSARITIQHGEPPAGEMYVDFYARPVATVAAAPSLSHETIEIDGALVAFHRSTAMSTTGEFFVLNGDTVGGGQWLATGLTRTVDATTGVTPGWVRLTLHRDYSLGTWNLWVDNQLVALNCGCLTPATQGETTYVAWNSTGQALHVDDLYLSKTDDSRIGSPTAPGGQTYTEGSAGNGLTADDEARYGTSPYTSDTDGDGVTDLVEIQRGTNPRDSADNLFDTAQDSMQDITLTLGPHKGGTTMFTARLYESLGPGTPEMLRYTFKHPTSLIATNDGQNGNPVPFRCRSSCWYVLRLFRDSGTADHYVLNAITASVGSTAVPTRPVVIADTFKLCRPQGTGYSPASTNALTGKCDCTFIGAPPAEIYYGPGLTKSTGDAAAFQMTQTTAGTATIKFVKNRCDITPVIRSGRYDVLGTSTSANGREITYTIGLPGWGSHDWLRTLSGAVSPYLSEPTGGPSWLNETPGRGMVSFDASGGGAGPGVTRIAQFETSASLNIGSSYTGGGPGPRWYADMATLTSAEDENDQEASGGNCAVPVPEVPPVIGASGNEDTRFDDGWMMTDNGGGGGCCGGGGGQQSLNQRSYSRADQGRHVIRAGADVDSRASAVAFATSGAEGRQLPLADGRSLTLTARGGATLNAPDSQGRPTRLNLRGSTAPGVASAATAAIAFTYPTSAQITATVISIAANGAETIRERYQYSNPTASSFQVLREREDGTDVTNDLWSTSGTTLSGFQETTIRTHIHSIYGEDGVSIIGGLKSKVTYWRASSQSATRTVDTQTWRFDSNLQTFTVPVLHRKVTWKRYAFGERIIKEELFPIGGGTARVTDYGYYETTGNGYGQIKSTVSSPSTRWVYHQYDAQGRPTLTVQQYLGNAAALDGTGFPTAGCQDSNVVFAVEEVDANTRWEVVRIAGKETFRRKYTRAGNQVTALTQLAPGTGAAGYSSTATYHAPGAAWYLAGRPDSVTRSDGTATQWNWATNSVTILNGLINAQNLNEGTAATTVWHPGGRGVASRVVTEKRGAVTQTVSSVTYATTFDPATEGYTRTATQLDGTKSQEIWHGTHLESSIARDGTITEYFLDAQGRADRTRTLAGGHLLEYRSVFDDAGQVIQSLQQPFSPASPNTQLANARVREIREYDGFGEVSNRQTLLPSGSFLPTDLIRDETSTPGLLKSIAISRPAGAPAPATAHETHDETVSYADGRFKEQWRKFTAGAAPVKVREVEYGVWADGTWDREIRYRTGTETAATAVEWVKRYYKMGRLVQVETPPASTSVSTTNGNAFLTHDAHGRLASRKDADGVTTLYAYNSLGEVEKEALDRNGDGVINEGGGYDRVLKTVTELTSRTEGGATKETRRVTTTTLTGSLATDVGTLSKVETAHDGSVSWSEGAGGTTKRVSTRTTNAGGFTLTETSVRTGPTNAVTSSTEAQGYTATALDADGTTTTYIYDLWGRHWKTTDGRNNTTEYMLAANDAVSVIKAPGSEPGTSTFNTIRTFDHMGRVATETKHGASGPTVYYYDVAGRLIGQGEALAYTSAYGYDLQGRMTALTTYRDTNNMAATAQTTYWTFNPLGQVIVKTYPLADSDGDGTLDAAPGTVSYAYSSAGRLLLRTWARGHRTRYYYNPRSGELNYLDYRGPVSGGAAAHEYNGADDTDTRDVSFHYDRAGNLLWVHEGTLTATPLFATGTVTITPNGSNSQVAISLNVTGQQSWAAGLNGSTTDYALWFSSGNALDGDQNFTYYINHNSTTGIRTLYYWMTGLTTGTTSVEIENECFTQSGFAPAFRYDHAPAWPASLSKETWSGLTGVPQSALERTYTGTAGQGQFAGTVLKENATARATTGWTRDAQGRIASFTDGATTLATYTYEPGTGGMFDTITTPLPNAGSSSLVADHTYEPRRDILNVRENKLGSSGPVVSRYDYTVNSLGQRREVEMSGTAFSATTGWVWGYDSLGQLTSAQHSNDLNLHRIYAYDSIGNRTQAGNESFHTGYNTSPANAYSKVWADIDGDGVHDAGEAAETLKYDLDGNLIEDGDKKYAWDGANRLRKVWRKAAPSDLLLATYEYDYRSRRLRKTTTSSAPQGALTLSYLYDAWNPVAEYESTDGTTHSLRRTRYWGLDISGTRQGAGGVSGLVTTREWTGTGTSVTTVNAAWYYYTYDGNGNVSEVLNSAGSITAHFEYDPFGNLTFSGGPTTGTAAYRFSTKPQDRELGDAAGNNGWYYYGYRYYDPVKGRWTSRDPIGEKGGLNLFGMVGNGLLGRQDYLGLNWLDEAWNFSADYLSGNQGWIPGYNTKENVKLCCGCVWEFLKGAGINGIGQVDEIMDMLGDVAADPCAYISELMESIGGVADELANGKLTVDDLAANLAPEIADLIKKFPTASIDTRCAMTGAAIAAAAGAAKGLLPKLKNLRNAAKNTPRPKDGSSMTTDQALTEAQSYLGEGYRQLDNGVYVSKDGTRLVRMTDSDLAKADNHAGAPHMNFEEGKTITTPNLAKPGGVKETFKTKAGGNSHIYLPEEQ